jgi:hypothetical protein
MNAHVRSGRSRASPKGVLERAVRFWPARYFAERDREGGLLAVLDSDTGRLWVRLGDAPNAWASVE